MDVNLPESVDFAVMLIGIGLFLVLLNHAGNVKQKHRKEHSDEPRITNHDR